MHNDYYTKTIKNIIQEFSKNIDVGCVMTKN